MSKEQELKEMLKLYSKQELWNRMQEKQATIYDLQSQLAEKDKEIEYRENNWNELCDYLGECIAKYDEIDEYGIYSEVLEKVNKLKKYDTSLVRLQNQKAIEQLEKLKYTINVNQVDNGYTDEQVDLYELNETINQQINELKGKVEK